MLMIFVISQSGFCAQPTPFFFPEKPDNVPLTGPAGLIVALIVLALRKLWTIRS